MPVNRLNRPKASTGCSEAPSRDSEVASEKVVSAHPTPHTPLARGARYLDLPIAAWFNASGESIQFPGTDIPGHILVRSWEPESSYDRGYPCCTPAHGLFLIRGLFLVIHLKNDRLRQHWAKYVRGCSTQSGDSRG